MLFNRWLAFLIAIIIICASPGPNMLHMMNSGARYGLRRTFFSMAGCFCAVLLLISLSVAGIGALLQASPLLFKLLRIAGAAYLIWLGICAWRTPGARTNIDAHTLLHPEAGESSTLFKKGFLVGISNPKALFFAGAFFPQFIIPGTNEASQLAILLLTFTVVEISCYTGYALGGTHIAAMLSRSTFRKTFNRITGTLFALFGLLMLGNA